MTNNNRNPQLTDISDQKPRRLRVVRWTSEPMTVEVVVDQDDDWRSALAAAARDDVAELVAGLTDRDVTTDPDALQKPH